MFSQFPFPPTLCSRLAQRLGDIAGRQRLRTDTTALIALCEKADNDIRSCLSTLQFFWSRGRPLRMEDVQKANVGQKDVQKGHFAVWRELFEVQYNRIHECRNIPDLVSTCICSPNLL